MAQSHDDHLGLEETENGTEGQRGSRSHFYLSYADSFDSEDSRQSGSIDYDPDLDNRDNEESTWSESVDPEIFRQLSTKERKRQNVIYELIQTETQYVRILNVTKKIYRDRMKTELEFPNAVLFTIFPALDEILELNGSFLAELRTAQNADRNICVERVGKIILENFTGEKGDNIQEAYAYFVSHKEKAVNKFKELSRNNTELHLFSERCVRDKRSGRMYLDECLTYISMRLTKYPLLIEAILKATKETDVDYVDLKAALVAVKKVLTGMDTQVQLEEIRQRIDNLSIVELKNGDQPIKLFKGYKAISKNAKLMYEKRTKLLTKKSKVYEILLVITDTKVILFHEQHTTRKLQLFDADPSANPPVLQLKGIIQLRKKAVDPRGAFIIGRIDRGNGYLIELLFENEKQADSFIGKLEVIRQQCANDEDDDDTDEEQEAIKEEEMRLERIKELLEELYSANQKIQIELENKNELLEMLLGFTTIPAVRDNGETGVEENSPTNSTSSESNAVQVQNKSAQAKSPALRRKDFHTQRYTPPGSPKVRCQDTASQDKQISNAATPPPKIRHKNIKSNSFGAVDKKTRRISPVYSHFGSLPMSLMGSDNYPDKEFLGAKASWLTRKFLPQPKSHTDISKFLSLSILDLKSYHSYSEELRSFINTSNDTDLQIANLRIELHMCQIQKTKLEHELWSSREKVKKYKQKVHEQKTIIHGYEMQAEEERGRNQAVTGSRARPDVNLVGNILDYQVHQV